MEGLSDIVSDKLAAVRIACQIPEVVSPVAKYEAVVVLVPEGYPVRIRAVGVAVDNQIAAAASQCIAYALLVNVHDR